MELDLHLIFGFLLVSFIAVATPGPSTLFVVRQAGTDGLLAGLACVGGILAADALFLLAGALGVGAALAAAPSVIGLIKVVGAAYFLYLSWRMASPHLRFAGVGDGSGAAATSAPSGGSMASGRSSFRVTDGLRCAFLMHILNTKALLFFSLLVPQFVRAGEALPPQIGMLMGLHLTLAALILTGYAMFGVAFLKGSGGSTLSKPLDLISALVMLVLSGSILATDLGR